MICLPLYRVLSDTFPWIQPLYSGTMENRQRWQDLAEKVEMGLTWIDHDTIDKPIEEFTGGETIVFTLQYEIHDATKLIDVKRRFLTLRAKSIRHSGPY